MIGRAVPQNYLADAKRRLSEAYALLDARIDDLNASEPAGSLHDRLVVARECVRDAIDRVEHAEQAIGAGRPEQSAPPPSA